MIEGYRSIKKLRKCGVYQPDEYRSFAMKGVLQVLLNMGESGQYQRMRRNR